ncbi:MAG: MMPL family transporter [Spirochaetaceae bacterium]|nr:MMPL family transporter [Spirochaetaceae bacterium]MCF7952293.1 MMPL family transporter [Spirochaetaceae bacterium]
MKKLYRYPWLNIILILGVTVFFAVQLPKTQLDNDVMNFIPEDHPEALAFEKTTDLFGSSMILGVGIKFDRQTVFTAEHLQLVRELTTQFESFDHVEAVMSLSNTDYIEGTAEGMQVSPLAGEDFQGTEEQILQMKEKLFNWDIYEGTLYSEDFTATQILVTFEDDLEAAQRSTLYYQIEDAMEAIEDPPIEYHIAGNPAITVLVTDNMKDDMITLIPLVVIVVLLALYLSFRRLGGVIISMITVILSTTWTIGAMALLGVPLSMVATVIPVLMIAVGSAYGIHILSHYYDELAHCREHVGREEHNQIIFETMQRIGRPVFLAGITTLAGFGALSTSQVVPMRNFGIFTAFGVLAAVVVALIFIPSLLLVRTQSLKACPDNQTEGDEGQKQTDHKTVLSLYHFFSSRKLRILFLALVVAIGGIYGSSKVIRDNAVIEYFKVDSPVRQSDRFLRENFSGTEFFDIVVRGEEAGDLTHPEILKSMDNLSRHITAEYDKVAKINSFSDFIKRMNQVMNYPPESAEAGAQREIAGVSSSPTAGTAESAESGEAAGTDSSSGSEDSNANTSGFSFFGQEDSNGDSPDSGSENNGSSFDSGFSVQADTSAGTSADAADGESSGDTYTDGFGGGFDSGFSADSQTQSQAQPTKANGPAAEGTAQTYEQNKRNYLQPVDFGSPFTYGDFAVLLNEARAGSQDTQLTVDEFVEQLNRRMNYKGSAYYEIPYNPDKYPAQTRAELKNLISQYLLLYSGSMDDWADDALEPRQVRMTAQLRTTGTRETEPIIAGVHEYVDRYFPEGYTVETTGSALVKNALTDLLIDAQGRSILISLSLVFLIVAFNFRSLIAGLLGIIPMGFAIIINFAVMGFFGIKLDISTAMVASVAIGIGIDYSIHFMSNYHYERLRSDNIEQVTVNTLRTTGKAISVNAIAVAAGFAVLIFSNFNPLMYLGMLIALTMFTSSLAAMTLLPVLLNIFKPKFISKPLRTMSNGG